MEKDQNIDSFSFQVEENISSPKNLFAKKTLNEIGNIYSNKIYASSFKNNGKKN